MKVIHSSVFPFRGNCMASQMNAGRCVKMQVTEYCKTSFELLNANSLIWVIMVINSHYNNIEIVSQRRLKLDVFSLGKYLHRT